MRQFAITIITPAKLGRLSEVDFAKFGEEGEELELWVYLEAYVEAEPYNLGDIMSVVEVTRTDHDFGYRLLPEDPDADNSPPFWVNSLQRA